MENQVLSIEQMQKLKELGVDTSKASMCYISKYPSCDFSDGDKIVVVSNDFNKRLYNEFGPAFTLQDIIELLPKKIRDFELNWYMHNMIIRYDYYNSFDGIDVLNGSSFGFCDNNSFLESAYEMLVWVTENGYLKSK